MTELKETPKAGSQAFPVQRLISRDKLRQLANDALWTGGWYDAGCNTVHCDYDGKDEHHDEIAHPCPLGVTGYIAAVHPRQILALLDELDAHTANAT